ncbi:hypothetical protein C6502_12520 [Candidatus Poribacteria bacterium]|nr:MAG: hypothetical protein C6502_12520 [Candidatus Poribacteria bacterium]
MNRKMHDKSPQAEGNNMASNLTPEDLILSPDDLSAETVEQILEIYGFQDVNDVNRRLHKLADAPPYREAFAEIVSHLLSASADSPDPEAALNNFERFVSASFDRLWLYRLLHDAPFLLRILSICFGSSNYFSDILVRNPEYFYELIDAEVMRDPKDRETMYRELSQAVRPFDLAEQKLNAVRGYKRKESLRLGLRDLLGDADLETTTRELTNLAEVTLQICYEIGTAELTEKMGTPSGELPNGEKVPSTLAVIAMGKFGGYELNFSSDIDVMFVYSHDGVTNQGVENQEYFAKLSEFIINGMSQVTKAGYVFRVDVRLRPESRAGAIARSVDNYEAYYEGWGEIWERQALIKARPVAGDLKLGEQFIRTVQPFVYQRYLDEFFITEIKLDIRQTKARIESRIREQGDDLTTHVKLGIGGIRDVEFTIQCLQLIHGGPNPALRNYNSLETIELLHQHGVLDQTDRDALADAYRFLRTVEHRIQMKSDLQRYSLPSKESELIQLAKRIGYQDSGIGSALEAFQADYARHTSTVRQIFEKILAAPISDREIDVATLLTTNDLGIIRSLLEPIAFADVREAHRRLKLMADGPDGVRFSPQVRRLFVDLAPTLLRLLGEAPDPDMAVRYIETFASRVGARSSHYALFNEQPATLELLTKLCGTSRFLAELLTGQPESFDVLTAPAVMDHPKTSYEICIEVLQEIADGRADQVFETLRRYKNSEVLRIGMRNILGQANLWATTTELSDLAEGILQAMYAHISTEFQNEYGEPLEKKGNQQVPIHRDTNEKTDVDLPVAKFAVIGMGKFGGRELNFSADLDLMLVYSAEGETTQGTPNAEYFSKLGLEMVNRLKGNTGGGEIYELDLRLRPFGSGGAIALSLAGYQSYYEKDAEIWERQALIRARPVAGDIELGQQFVKQAHAFAYSQPLTAEGIAYIVHNRQRKEEQATRPPSTSRRRRGRRKQQIDVKSGYGGLIDIEFVAQTLQLIHGTTHPQVRAQNTVEAIHQLHEIGVLTVEQRDQLRFAYEFLRNVENSLRIVHDRPLDALPDTEAALEQLAKRLGYEDGVRRASDSFLRDYQWCTETTRTLFNQLLNGQ